MSSATLLVTGANGHLGRRLLERLSGSGTTARAVVRSERAARTLHELAPGARPEIRVLDYADEDALTRAAEGCRACVHLVGILRESAASRYAAAHEGSCTALARAAGKAGLRRIVYLSILGADPASGNACLASKGRAERILLDAETPTLVLRVPMVIGEGDFAARSLRRQARARLVPLVRGGRSLEQPIDARDVVAAVRAGLEREDLGDRILELAGPESLARHELLRRCAALHGTRPRIVPVPLAAARAAAALLARLSANPPLTPAMLGVLEHDDRVDPTEATRLLDIRLTPLDETLRRCAGPGADG